MTTDTDKLLDEVRLTIAETDDLLSSLEEERHEALRGQAMTTDTMLDELADLVRRQPPARVLDLMTMLREAADLAVFWVKDEDLAAWHGPYEREADANRKAADLGRDKGHATSVWSAGPEWPACGSVGPLFTGFYFDGKGT